jgi:hypothetical protein
MEYAEHGDIFQKILANKKNKTIIPESEIWKVLYNISLGKFL